MAFPTTDSHVSAAERELGVSLPREYRERLISSNGGELSTAGDDWQVFPVFDATSRKTAGRSAGHIVLETRSARAWNGFPEGAWPAQPSWARVLLLVTVISLATLGAVMLKQYL